MTTTAPFAAIEQRLNSAIFAALPNAIASIGTATGVPVIFDKSYVNLMNMDASKPAIYVQDSRLVGVSIPRGTPVSLDVETATYTIADKQPDGHGITLIILDKA